MSVESEAVPEITKIVAVVEMSDGRRAVWRATNASPSPFSGKSRLSVTARVYPYDHLDLASLYHYAILPERSVELKFSTDGEAHLTYSPPFKGILIDPLAGDAVHRAHGAWWKYRRAIYPIAQVEALTDLSAAMSDLTAFLPDGSP